MYCEWLWVIVSDCEWLWVIVSDSLCIVSDCEWLWVIVSDSLCIVSDFCNSQTDTTLITYDKADIDKPASQQQH